MVKHLMNLHGCKKQSAHGFQGVKATRDFHFQGGGENTLIYKVIFTPPTRGWRYRRVGARVRAHTTGRGPCATAHPRGWGSKGIQEKREGAEHEFD